MYIVVISHNRNLQRGFQHKEKILYSSALHFCLFIKVVFPLVNLMRHILNILLHSIMNMFEDEKILSVLVEMNITTNFYS